MIFAIRDDDTSFYTKPDELKRVYDFVSEGCVSLSIVPFAVPYHKTSTPYGEGYENVQRDICDNEELLAFLKEEISKGAYSAMLHGYSHEYKKANDIWQPEMLWKESERIHQEIAEGKKHLESALDTDISVFVPPNNRINEKAIDALEKNGLNLSGIIGRTIDRRIDGKYIKNYIHRTYYKLKYDIPYGGVYEYKGHKELYAYPIISEEYLLGVYKLCKAQGLPFVIYTHYFELLADNDRKEALRKIYEYALNDGAKLVSVNECFEAYKQKS